MLPPVLIIIKLTKKNPRNLWMIFGFVEVEFLQCKYVYQACHVTCLLKISSKNLKLGNQSESQFLNPFMWLVGQPQNHGGNFKMIGHMTSLIPCKYSSRWCRSKSLCVTVSLSWGQQVQATPRPDLCQSSWARRGKWKKSEMTSVLWFARQNFRQFRILLREKEGIRTGKAGSKGEGGKGAGHSFELWLSFDRVICRLDVVETVSIDKSLFFRHLTFFATGGVGVSLLLPTTRPALGHGWVVVA